MHLLHLSVFPKRQFPRGKYVETCVEGFFPFKLHGDCFIDLIEPWLKDFYIAAPRSEHWRLGE